MLYIYEIDMIETFSGMELEITDYDGEIIGYAKDPKQAEKIIEHESRINNIMEYDVSYNY